MRLALLLLVSAFVLFFGLQSGSLATWDEAVYAQVSREILQRGVWADLYWYGTPWWDKPPLFFWIMALFFKIFGVSEFAARFGAALFGMGTIVVTYLFAKRLFDADTAFFSTGILISTLHFMRFSKMAMLDVPMTFFITAALFCFWIARTATNLGGARGGKGNFFFAVGIFFGLAVLTKGVSALFIPLTIFLFAVLSKEYTSLFNRKLILGFIIGIAITLPWHFFEYGRYGKIFLDRSLFTHLLRRTTTVLDEHSGNALYYVHVLMNKGRPWGMLGIFSSLYLLWLALRRNGAGLALSKKKEIVFLLSWILVIFSISTLARTKLPWYIVPIYPAISIASGAVVERVFKRKWFLFFMLLLVIIFSYSFKYRIFDLDLNREMKELALYRSGTGLASLQGGSGSTPLTTRRVYIYRVSDPGAVFYFGGAFEKVDDETELARIIAEEKDALFLLSWREYDALRPRFPNLGIIGRSNYYVLLRN